MTDSAGHAGHLRLRFDLSTGYLPLEVLVIPVLFANWCTKSAALFVLQIKA